ncbi:hypothetical protein AYX13_06698 [Cryptococcus neoformans]|nr:hypothetical protein AYX13_06698 [Cryptococcus neoformans var. grubii]
MDTTDSTDAAAGPSKRRRANVGKACLNCRKRKAKCTGQPPSCQTCQLYNDECKWGEDDDGRKPASRQFVQSLKNRIKSLEAALEARGQLVPSLGDEGHGESDNEEEMVDRVSQAMLHLQIGMDGEQVHYHGPTSAYAHLSVAPILRDVPSGLMGGLSDFRRFLPPINISAPQHALALDRFFRFFASWGMRTVPNLFHRDLALAINAPSSAPPPRTTYYSPMLHNCILAIALMFMDDQYLRDPATRKLLADEAVKYMEIELPRPTLATVQALALRSSYHSTLGDHTVGWTYFGLAERAAQSLGLNVDSSPLVKNGRMSEAEMLLRNNTWWTIFIQDQCWSVYIGRPHSMQDHNTPLPLVDPSLDALPWTWTELSSGETTTPPQDCMLSSAFVETAKLSLIMQKVMTTLYSLRSDASRLQRDGAISELSLALDTWREQLPPNLVLTGHSNRNALPHVIMLQLAWEWLVILCYRSYYRFSVRSGSRAEPEGISAVAVKRCDRSAARINSLLRAYHNRFNLRFSPPTLLNVAFTAGTTHLLAAVHHRSIRIRAEALASANECVELLRLVAVSWPAARDKADILGGLVTEYLPTETMLSRLDLLSRLNGTTAGTTAAPTASTPTSDPLFDFFQQPATDIAPPSPSPLQQVLPSSSPVQSPQFQSIPFLPPLTQADYQFQPVPTLSSSLSMSGMSQQPAPAWMSQSPTVDNPLIPTEIPMFDQNLFSGIPREDAESFLRALLAHITLPPAQAGSLPTAPHQATAPGSFFSQIYPNNAAYGQSPPNAWPIPCDTSGSAVADTTIGHMQTPAAPDLADDQEWANFFGAG